MNNYTQLASAYRWHLISISLLGVIVLADLYYKKVSLDTLDIIPIAIASLKVSTPWTIIVTLIASLSNYYLDQIQPFREAIWMTTIKDTVVFVLTAIGLDQYRRKLEIVVELSRVDPLTGLANKRALDEAIYEAAAILEREKQPFSVVFIDIDNFKWINDNYNHYTGDRVIQLFSQWLKFAFRRKTDTIARKGGDEFVIVMRHSHGSGARVKLDEFITLLLKKFFLVGPEDPNNSIVYSGSRLAIGGKFIDLTRCGISVGIATFYELGNNRTAAIGLPDLLISKASANCMSVKKAGGRDVFATNYGKKPIR
jgi:diguanylate cyclase (GGDEF)-like protein